MRASSSGSSFPGPTTTRSINWSSGLVNARPTAREPVAVEEGVAVRGLDGRPVRSYPSTEAILEAVVQREGESRLCDLDTGCMAGP